MKASKNFTEVKIIKRGDAYITPLKPNHLSEIILHKKNAEEVLSFGYDGVFDALKAVYKNSEAYICRNKDGKIIFISGLWFSRDEDPQMFFIFSKYISENVFLMAKMGKALLNMFDICHPTITMNILAKNKRMIYWAEWLGFSFVGTDNVFIEFVRCNFNENNVTHKTLRPITH